MPQVTVIKAVEGASNVIIRVNMVSDGSGELINFPFFAASDLTPPRQNRSPSFNLVQAWYSMVWYDVTLFAGTLSPVQMWTFARDCDSHIDFRSFRGILDQNVYVNPPVVDDGVLNISTNNFAPVGSTGTLVLELQKTNYAAV